MNRQRVLAALAAAIIVPITASAQTPEVRSQSGVAAVRAANNAIQVHGGAGYVDDFPVAKYLRDARVMTLYEGTSQIQKLLIGRAETGVSAFT